MTLLFGFAPFLLFAILSRLSADLALWLAFAASFVVTIRDFVESPSLRLLDGASPRPCLRSWRWCAASFCRSFRWRPGPHHRGSGPLSGDLRLAFAHRPFSLEYASQESRTGLYWPAESCLHSGQSADLAGLGYGVLRPCGATGGRLAVTFLPVPFYVGIATRRGGARHRHITFTLRYPALAAKRLAR